MVKGYYQREITEEPGTCGGCVHFERGTLGPTMENENVGTCLCCGRQWGKVQPHETRYSEYTGVFPLCEECWGKLSPEDRLPFYDALMIQWEVIDGYTITAAEREEIKAAVLSVK